MTIQFEVPDALEMTERQVRAFLAAKFYEAGKLSFGKAAEMAGYTKATFMELLADFGVDYFQITEEDLESDLANAKRYHQRQQLSHSA